MLKSLPLLFLFACIVLTTMYERVHAQVCSVAAAVNEMEAKYPSTDFDVSFLGEIPAPAEHSRVDVIKERSIVISLNLRAKGPCQVLPEEACPDYDGSKSESFAGTSGRRWTFSALGGVSVSSSLVAQLIAKMEVNLQIAGEYSDDQTETRTIMRELGEQQCFHQQSRVEETKTTYTGVITRPIRSYLFLIKEYDPVDGGIFSQFIDVNHCYHGGVKGNVENSWSYDDVTALPSEGCCHHPFLVDEFGNACCGCETPQ